MSPPMSPPMSPSTSPSMPADLPKSVARFVERAAAAGLAVAPVLHEGSARTAEEAAERCGCTLAQIVKSLLFQGADSAEPILVLAAGDNRVDQKAIAAVLGEGLIRPDAAYVRDVTGYAIGGVPPLGHDRALKTLLDRDLLSHARIWAAAGAPNAVFETAPPELQRATGATVVDV